MVFRGVKPIMHVLCCDASPFIELHSSQLCWHYPQVSDCGAVGGGPKGAIESLTAGTDLECNPWGGSLYPSLVNSTLAGNVTAAAIAQAAERMLYVRFRLGAFDDPATVPFADKSKVWAPPTLPRGHAVIPHTHPHQPRLDRIRRHRHCHRHDPHRPPSHHHTPPLMFFFLPHL